MNMQANITLSNDAKNHLAKLIDSSKDQNSLLRISVTGGGCSGFQYHFDFVEEKHNDDLEITTEKKTFGLIDPSSHKLLSGSEIVFVDSLGGSYFKIENPKASSTCGCGSSFNI